MRKGEEKKQEIMRVAERLFCRNGFRETGVQDILDALKISKGAFYHYFESKDAVLEMICAEHAGAAAVRPVVDLPPAPAPELPEVHNAKVARALFHGTCDHGLRKKPGEHLGLNAYDVDRQHVPQVSGITIS